MEQFTVGQKFEGWNGEEGCRYDAPSGFLIVAFNRPTTEEITSTGGVLELGSVLLSSQPWHVIFLFRLGCMPWCEAFYNAHLAGLDAAPGAPNLIKLIALDAADSRIFRIRAFSTGERWRAAHQRHLNEHFNHPPVVGPEYHRRVNESMLKASTMDFVRIAKSQRWVETICRPRS